MPKRTKKIPYYAIKDGVVIENAYDYFYGWYVTVEVTPDVFDNETDQYGYLTEESPLKVGDTVHKGDLIGFI